MGIAELQEAATRFGASFAHFELTSQYRCGGSLRYLNWLDALLAPNGDPAR